MIILKVTLRLYPLCSLTEGRTTTFVEPCSIQIKKKRTCCPKFSSLRTRFYRRAGPVVFYSHQSCLPYGGPVCGNLTLHNGHLKKQTLFFVIIQSSVALGLARPSPKYQPAFAQVFKVAIPQTTAPAIFPAPVLRQPLLNLCFPSPSFKAAIAHPLLSQPQFLGSYCSTSALPAPVLR